MKKFLYTLLAVLMLLVPLSGAEAAGAGWDPVYKHIEKMINQGVDAYSKGDTEGAKKLINDSYYAVYETDGLEKAIRTTLSSKNANATEYQYTKLKAAIRDKKSQAEVKAEADKLLGMMRNDIKSLKDNTKGAGRWASFWPAFFIILREGMEAILMLVAIMAYLVKTGNQKYLDTIYNYANMAVLASFATAYICNKVIGAAASGASRELLEGVTALIAVCVLLSASLWLSGKTQAANWKKYIEGIMKKTMSSRRANAIGMAAFLAVYREGAEVILFFQTLFNGSSADTDMIWYGGMAGFVVILLIFFIMVEGLVHIPLRPFFITTTVFMFCLAVAFLGSGIYALQEAGVVSQTGFEAVWFPEIDWLGLYPTLETFLPQLGLLAVGAAMYFYQSRKTVAEA